MRRRYCIIICPAVLCFLFLLVVTVYADSRDLKRNRRTDRGSSLYPAGYDSKAVRSNRDIMPEGYRGYEFYMSERSKGRPSVKKAVSSRKSSSKYYTVKKGDTLYRISSRLGIRVDELKSLNKIGRKNRIFAGMKLRIPLSSENIKSSPAVRKKASASSKPSFRWPVKRIRSCRRDGSSSVKSIGIIIKSSAGQPVIASENGIVERVGYMRGFGNYIVIKHRKRYVTVYSNIGRIKVNEGENVKRGGVIGSLDKDPILHFQIDYAGKAKNPLDFLPARG